MDWIQTSKQREKVMKLALPTFSQNSIKFIPQTISHIINRPKTNAKDLNQSLNVHRSERTKS